MPSLMLHGDEEPPAPRGPSVVASGGDARDTLNLRSALLLLLFSRGSSAQGLCTLLDALFQTALCTQLSQHSWESREPLTPHRVLPET